MRKVICNFTKQSLPHGNGSNLPHLFLISTTINSKKSEMNDFLYHAPGNLIFHKTILSAW